MEKENLGLTDVEFKLFQKILEKGETALGPIIKELGIHKGTAYNSIRRLEEKGFVSFKEVEGVNIYSVNILSLKKHQEELEKTAVSQLENIKNIIAEAKTIKKAGEASKVHVLVGEEGFKTFFNDLYDWAYKTKKEYLFMGKGNEMIEHLGEEYYKTTQIKKKKLGLKCRVILNEISMKLSVSRYVIGNVRYLKMDYLSPVSTWIYDNNVIIVLWDSKPILTVVIESKEAVNSYKSFFETMWEMAYAPKRIFESRQKVNIFDFISGAKKSLDVCGINCLQPIHEGRNKIIDLLSKGGRVRILFADPFSKELKKRVFLEERYIKNLDESRILFELKAALANLKDIEKRVKKNIEVRFYGSKPEFSLIIVDDKKVLFNRYGEKSGRYGASYPSLLIDGNIYPAGAKEISEKFEELWKNSKVIPIDKIIG